MFVNLFSPSLKKKIENFLIKDLGFGHYATRVQDGSFVNLGHIGDPSLNVAILIASAPSRGKEVRVDFYSFEDNWNLDSQKRVWLKTFDEFMIEFDDFCKGGKRCQP